MTRQPEFHSQDVADTFASYPPKIRRQLLVLRALILEIATTTAGVGEIEETLKWGEPAYLTRNKSGSSLRIAWKPTKPAQFGLYVNCQTDLIETFRRQFAGDLAFEGNRGIIFQAEGHLPLDKLAICIAATLTYHQRHEPAKAGATKAGARKAHD